MNVKYFVFSHLQAYQIVSMSTHDDATTNARCWIWCPRNRILLRRLAIVCLHEGPREYNITATHTWGNCASDGWQQRGHMVTPQFVENMRPNTTARASTRGDGEQADDSGERPWRHEKQRARQILRSWTRIIQLRGLAIVCQHEWFVCHHMLSLLPTAWSLIISLLRVHRRLRRRREQICDLIRRPPPGHEQSL